jgi:hypothetical protein
MGVFDPSISVIVGGIAGMTLSMTGVKNMFDLGRQEFAVKNNIDDPAFFSTESKAAWTTVINNTLLLVVGFFISEVCVLVYFVSGDGCNPDKFLQALGYFALLFTLGLMIAIYILTVWDFQRPPKKLKELDSMTDYPEPQPPSIAPP